MADQTLTVVKSEPLPTLTVKSSEPSTPVPPRSTWDDVGEFAKELWAKQPIHPIDMVTGTAQAVAHPIATAQAIGQAQTVPLEKAKAAFQRGDYAEGVRHALMYLIPIIGPQMDESTDLIPGGTGAPREVQPGDTAKGLGGMVGAGLQVALPEMARRMPKVPPVVKVLNRPGPNTVEAEAIQYGQNAGIPIDAATATRSPWVASVQKTATDSMGGSGTAERFKVAQEAALTAQGRAEAARANVSGTGLAQTAETAGQGAATGVRDVISAESTKANTAYDKLRQLELASPQEVISTNPDGTGLKAVRLGVDLRPTKAALQPLFERLTKEREISGGLFGDKGRALGALQTIMEGPDVESLSVVDGALSDIKAVARGADMPELRNPAQSAAALAVKNLDSAVRGRARQAGANVYNALMEGRAATVSKYAAEKVLDQLTTGTGGESVRIFDRLTSRDDTAINLLRSLKTQAPQALPEVGRAFLDDLIETATSEGGFGSAKTIQTAWKKMGDETKALLFTPEHIADLDDFFRLAKMIGENPNPSGTARTLNATNITLALPMKIASSLFYTPAGVKLLTQGLKIPAAAGKASKAVSALMAQMTKVATQNRALALNPALASDLAPIGMPAVAQQGPQQPTIK